MKINLTDPANQLRAFRADGGDISQGRIKEIADNAYGDEEKRRLAQRLLVAEAGLQEHRKPAEPVVPDYVSGPLAHAYKELTPTFMRNHIAVFERYGLAPKDSSTVIQALRIALDGIERHSAMLNLEKLNFGVRETETATTAPEQENI